VATKDGLIRFPTASYVGDEGGLAPVKGIGNTVCVCV